MTDGQRAAGADQPSETMTPEQLLAELRQHDAAMTEAPWDARGFEVWSVDTCHPDYDMRLASAGRTEPQRNVPVNHRDAEANAAGIAWLGTHRGELLALAEEAVRLRDAADRAVTIADEAFGPGPVEPIESTLTRIERSIAEQRMQIRELKMQLAAARRDLAEEARDRVQDCKDLEERMAEVESLRAKLADKAVSP